MKFRVFLLAAALLALPGVGGLTAAAAAEGDGDPFCSMFLSAQEDLSGSRGERINRLTAFAGVDVRCSEKLIDFRQAVLAPGSKLRDGWRERLQANWSSAYCRPGSKYLEAVRNGWTIVSTVTTSDGQEFQVKAVCLDAVALGKSTKKGAATL